MAEICEQLDDLSRSALFSSQLSEAGDLITLNRPGCKFLYRSGAALLTETAPALGDPDK
jgi:hypothetical protein